MLRQQSERVVGAVIGLVGTAVVTGAFAAFGRSASIAVPALLLLVPVALASSRAGWHIGVGVAFVAATAYALAFLEPIGSVRIGLTSDVYVLASFVAVAIVVGVSGGRRRAAVPPLVLDEDRLRLLRTVSHDLRSPLTTIKALSSDLLDRQTLDAATIGLVVDEADRLDRIVARLLDYTRACRGELLPELEPCAPADIVAACVNRLGRTGGDRLHADVEPGLPDVWADPVLIDQVLTNLAENGLKYGPAGGPVTVQVHRAAHGVEFGVLDPGTGVPAAGGGGTAVATGLGMGLAICEAIVTAHDATLTTTWTPGTGNLVSFVLRAVA